MNRIHPKTTSGARRETSSSIPHKNCACSIKSLDILGKKFTLKFDTKNGKFQTTLGGYLTIIMSLISFATSVVILSQYFFKDSPVVTNSTELGSEVAEFNLYDQKLFAPMGLGLGLDVLVPSPFHPKYTTFLAVIEETVFNNATQAMEVTSSQTIDFIPCIQLNDSKIDGILRDIVPLEAFQILMNCPTFTGIRKQYFVKKTQVEIFRGPSKSKYSLQSRG